MMSIRILIYNTLLPSCMQGHSVGSTGPCSPRKSISNMKRSISDEETDPCGCKVIVISDDEEEVPVKPENSRILRDESSGRISKRLAIEVSKDQAMDEEEGEGQPKQHNEMVIRIRLARCKMPKRFQEPMPPFYSCLDQPCSPSPKASDHHRFYLQEDKIAKDNWLNSPFINGILKKLARTYRSVHFMPVDFAEFALKKWDGIGKLDALDVLENRIDYTKRRPVVFFTHVRNIHWNLVRIQHTPCRELQLFEPMGKPASRQKTSRVVLEADDGKIRPREPGMSSRYVPIKVIEWLDRCWSLEEDGIFTSWQKRSFSAITRQHQNTGYDCGVACLLYAEKCGQMQMREDISEYTTQSDITQYRDMLMRYRPTFP